MGRASHQRALEVWANGEHVATWQLPSRRPMELVYTDAWLHSPRARPLSLSLPLGVGGSVLSGVRVESFFRNLLPDSEAIRRRMASKFRVATPDAFDLLEAVGRDCVGALQLLPPGVEPVGFNQVQAQPLSERKVAEHLRRTVTSASLGSQQEMDDFRISLAGAQEKSALLWFDGCWCLPHGATPTTHIMKLPLGTVGQVVKVDMSTSVENEWLCARILSAFGLDVAQSTIGKFEDQQVLVVERFDRRWAPDGSWIVRLPQEDFCQANGLPPTMKYEVDGGPGFGAIAEQLMQSTETQRDRNDFLTSQVLFWMLAAIDGHAKNFSIRLLPQGRYQLTPFYDVLSAWPVVGKGRNKWPKQKLTMAMAVEGANRHYHWGQIQRRHFNFMARKHGYNLGAEAQIQHLIEATPGVIQEVCKQLPADFPQSLADAVFTGLTFSALALSRMPES
jgi:serine/threonine-protein kinase HipA